MKLLKYMLGTLTLILAWQGNASTPCQPGTYSATGLIPTGQSTCTPCSVGTYSSQAGATICTACPANSSNAQGSSTCICNASYYSKDGSTGTSGTPCTWCPGTITQGPGYNSQTANIGCACPPGTLLTNTGCTPCPAGHYCPQTSISANPAQCPPGQTAPTK